MRSIKEISEELDLSAWFECEGVSHRHTHGASGPQINVRECPVCGDRRYRVYLNAETGLGNCFVCNHPFNKMGFLHHYYGDANWGETFRRAKEHLREQGWRPRRITTAAVEIPEEIRLPFSFPLPTDQGENLIYLEERGIDEVLARYFHLRYCETGWWRYREGGELCTQDFGSRVIIPVFDVHGTLKTFQGRDVTGNAERKYLFPKHLPGTGRYLLNGQNAIGCKKACMGEGAFDVMAIKCAFDEEVELRGVPALGTFGKHLSFGSLDGDDQLGALLFLKAHGLEEVTIMWDGEEKALIAALDAAKLMTRLGLRVRIALLPKDKDPNEVLPDVVRQAFWSATAYTSLLDVQWRLANPYRKR